MYDYALLLQPIYSPRKPIMMGTHVQAVSLEQRSKFHNADWQHAANTAFHPLCPLIIMLQHTALVISVPGDDREQ